MDIYILSRGTTSSQGFSWRKITGEGEKPTEPNIPPEFNSLIDANSPYSLLSSLVLGRCNGKLILYIAGLEASERRDNHQRKIYNSVVCIGQNADDEALIQTLTVKALQDELSDILNNVVKSSSDGSVEISSHKLIDEFQKLNTSATHGELSPTKIKKLGKLSQERKQQLAEEIAQLKYFPRKKNNLVVVTTISDKKDLENAGVWRGLSDKITLNNEQWEDVPQSRLPSIKDLIELLKNNIQEFISPKKTLLLTGFLVFLLLVNIGFIFYEIRLPATIDKKIAEKQAEYKRVEKETEIARSNLQKLETEKKNKLADIQKLDTRRNNMVAAFKKAEQILESQ